MNAIEDEFMLVRPGRATRQSPKEGLEALPIVPRITRLMALAIRIDDMVRRGELRDYADVARLGHVTRARITQIMNLLNLAPDIQEQILLNCDARALPVERQLRRLAACVEWSRQRRMWKQAA
jgi:hypothetical protein